MPWLQPRQWKGFANSTPPQPKDAGRIAGFASRQHRAALRAVPVTTTQPAAKSAPHLRMRLFANWGQYVAVAVAETLEQAVTCGRQP